MDNTSVESELRNKLPSTKWCDFLITAPSGVAYVIPDLWTFRDQLSKVSNGQDVRLPCESDKCGGERYFTASDQIYLRGDREVHGFVSYVCKNCGTSQKRYALYLINLDSDKKLSTSGAGIKVGEWPELRITIPSKVITFIGPDRSEFLQGLKAEAQGLGVGSLTYYRRVVNNQWRRILENIERAAKNLNATQEVLSSLSQATKETQFKRAVEMLGDGLPPSLLVRGTVNPLTLLYKATSMGIHALSDEQCLEVAKDIRLVLVELADRMTKALGDQTALDSAVSRLQNIDKLGSTSPSDASDLRD